MRCPNIKGVLKFRLRSAFSVGVCVFVGWVGGGGGGPVFTIKWVERAQPHSDFVQMGVGWGPIFLFRLLRTGGWVK